MNKELLLSNLRDGIRVSYRDIKGCVATLSTVERLHLEMRLQQRRFELLLSFAKDTGSDALYSEADAMRKGLFLLTGATRYNIDGDRYIDGEGRNLSYKQQTYYQTILQR
jgi:hypothetical protein